MKKRALLFIILILIIISQLTILSSFFYPIHTGGFGICCSSIVVVAKQSYVYGWITIDIQGPTTQNPATLQFFNGSKITLTSNFNFVMRLPRTGDCFCDAATDAYGVQLTQSQPIGAIVVSNSTIGSEPSALPNTTTINDGLFNVYWFTIAGYSLVTVSGYGVAY
jgi:hypothetical protein